MAAADAFDFEIVQNTRANWWSLPKLQVTRYIAVRIAVRTSVPWYTAVRKFVAVPTPSHQPFHPGLCVSLSRGRLPPVINHSTLAYRCVSLSRGRLPPVINHSTLAYVCHYPGADCLQSSTIPPWPMCVTIQGQTATSHQPFHPGLCVSLSRGRLPPGSSHQPFHPGLCVSLSRGRLPPVINHSTLAYVCHYPGADCLQSSTIPP